MSKPKYTIKPKDKGWQVIKPDGIAVNGATFTHKWQAERKLDTLVSFGYCTK